MAHAATPTDLAKQPATSTTNGLWQALLAVIVTLAIGASVVMLSATLAASKNIAPAGDHGFDQIEGQRGATTLSVQAAPFSDGSYDRIEADRGGAFTGTGAPVGGTAPDYGNGRIQGHREAMVSQ